MPSQPVTVDYRRSGTTVRPPTQGTSPTTSRVNDTSINTILRPVNINRISLTIVNESSAVLYVLKGTGVASSTNYTYKLSQNDTLTIDDYTGQVNGVWATDPNDGAAQMTEVAP